MLWVMSVTADPASGSDMATATAASPVTTRGRIRARCAGVPRISMCRGAPVGASKPPQKRGARGGGGGAAPAVVLADRDAEEAKAAEPPPLLDGKQHRVAV